MAVSKVTPEDIFRVLDGTVIATMRGSRLVYQHGGIRGYYVLRRLLSGGLKLTFLSGNMNDACRKFNAITGADQCT